ncbi:MAG: pirin family protein [Deltaproteobacteria bacterium]|nr:pirin family protein [Deltaproteobacteria bacterium]
MTSRTIASVAPGIRTFEGEGFAVRRAFPTSQLDSVDPFLLLDEMGPSDLSPGEAKGAPDHPHRGFETVTYLLAGRFEHRDSAGHAGSLGPGDVQWMTAGGGVVHSEMPGRDLVECGGRLHGFQLWVNLPARDKMIAPHYQEMAARKIPTGRSTDGLVFARVLAGEAFGQRAVIVTRTPILYLHLTLDAGANCEIPVPTEFGGFVFPFRGDLVAGIGAKSVAEGNVAILATGGDAIALSHPGTDDSAREALLVAGEPLREPVARYGPFVMNTSDEIRQAFRDYQSGKLGRILPEISPLDKE